jgi:uncharacterized membrane protein YphA (DoxX/SURF4 family)
MSGRAAPLVLRAGTAVLGLVWLAAGVSKAADPAAAYEFTARVVGGGAAAKVLLTAVAGAETTLGVAMVLGVLRGLAPTAVLLAAVTAALLHVRSRSGGAVGCGCFAVGASVDEALVRNVVLLGATAALGALAFISRRRDPGAGAASGPATPAP